MRTVYLNKNINFPICFDENFSIHAKTFLDYIVFSPSSFTYVLHHIFHLHSQYNTRQIVKPVFVGMV